MIVRIKHTSYIIDFLDKQFSSDKISEQLKPKLKEILNDLAPESLSKWELTLKLIYSGQDKILIFRKGRSYKDEKYKEIIVHIPIPTLDVVNWGVEKTQHIKTGLNENVLKHADLIEINPNCYNSTEEFIIDCTRKAIDELFRLGFSINKIKIKN